MDAINTRTERPSQSRVTRGWIASSLLRTVKVSTTPKDHQQWRKWISPVRDDADAFGGLSIVGVDADDIEAVRDALNIAISTWEASGKVRGQGLSYATAANVWSILTLALKRASTRKGDHASVGPADQVGQGTQVGHRPCGR